VCNVRQCSPNLIYFASLQVFSLIDHLQAYKLLCSRNLLLCYNVLAFLRSCPVLFFGYVGIAVAMYSFGLSVISDRLYYSYGKPHVGFLESFQELEIKIKLQL
jgi:hypothetical protein